MGMKDEGGIPVNDPIRSVWMPPCPSCGQLGVPILFGLPTREAQEAAGDGLVALAGCIRPFDPPHWQCPAHHRWSTSKDAWEAALDQAMWGRPRCRACGGATKVLIYGDDWIEYFQAELARGDAQIAISPGLPGEGFAHICRTCGATHTG